MINVIYDIFGETNSFSKSTTDLERAEKEIELAMNKTELEFILLELMNELKLLPV